jgi:hypothetical protein
MASIPPEAILRFSQYSIGATDDAVLAELSSLARAPENPELWEVNMHRHSQAYTGSYCQVAQDAVARALGEIRDFDPYVCAVGYNVEYNPDAGVRVAGPGGLGHAVIGRVAPDRATLRAPFVYSHMARHTADPATVTRPGLAVYFVASFVGESLGTNELGFVAMRHIIQSEEEAVSPTHFQCLTVDADDAGDPASWAPVGQANGVGRRNHQWIDGKLDGVGTWVFFNHDTRLKYTVIPSCGSVSEAGDKYAAFCTPDGVLHVDLPPVPLSTKSVSRRRVTERPWGCIQLLWDAGLYEDEHPMSASGDTDACERLLSYELAVSEESRRSSGDRGPAFFTLRAAGRTHHAGRVQSALVDLGELDRDEWCAESSQPFWQVVAQRTCTVATRSAAVAEPASDSSSGSADDEESTDDNNYNLFD